MSLKINLVVAAGVHQGKAIPVPNGKLTIGRDPSCQLRPASPAVSKMHCTIAVRDGLVYVTDHGSTNGTFVDDEQVSGEVQVDLGCRVRVGPLDFTIEAVPGSRADATPLPESLKSVNAAAPKLSDGVGMKPVAPSGGKTAVGVEPPASKATPAPQPAAAPPTATTPAPKPPVPVKPKPAASNNADDMAAMLLAEDDDSSPPSVPEGSTVMEMPSVDAEKLRQAGGGVPAGAPDKKKSASAAETSNAASELLKKYMRRPK